MKNSMTRLQKIGALLLLASVLIEDESIPLPHDVNDGSTLLFCHTKQQWDATLSALGVGAAGEDDDALTFIPLRIPFLKVYGFKTGILSAPIVAVEPIELEQPGVWAPEPGDYPF